MGSAHNVAPNAIQVPYWKLVHETLRSVSPSYTPMYPKKMFNEMLPLLRERARTELKEHLSYRKDIGRTLTGDGATKQSTPLINFLCHVPGKGVQLVEITDCTEHLRTGQVKDAM